MLVMDLKVHARLPKASVRGVRGGASEGVRSDDPLSLRGTGARPRLTINREDGPWPLDTRFEAGAWLEATAEHACALRPAGAGTFRRAAFRDVSSNRRGATRCFGSCAARIGWLDASGRADPTLNRPHGDRRLGPCSFEHDRGGGRLTGGAHRNHRFLRLPHRHDPPGPVLGSQEG
jgi:hypothetical protein